jgi:hypothetical protein
MTEKEKQEFETSLFRIWEKLNSIDESIRGNGKPGLMMRIDRLERTEVVRNRIQWGVGIVVLSMFVTMAVRMFLDHV